MKQKTDNLKVGDLIAINYNGYNHKWCCAIYIKSSKVSISYMNLSGYENHIRIRNSTTQRVYKITEDNLTSEELKI